MRAKASGEEDYGIDCGCVVLETTALDMKLVGDIVKAPEAWSLASNRNARRLQSRRPWAPRGASGGRGHGICICISHQCPKALGFLFAVPAPPSLRWSSCIPHSPLTSSAEMAKPCV